MMKFRCSGTKGFTLVETMVSAVIMGFIFSFTAFLIFMTGRNMLNVRDQVRSQTSAASAQERIVIMLRNSRFFALVGNDSPISNTLTRVNFVTPQPNGTATTSTLAWNSKTKEIVYFANAASVSWDGNKDPIGTPDRTFKNMSNFEMFWENPYRIRLGFYFQYKGFALYFTDGANPQYGQFITEVVAKNHFIYKGTKNYGDDDATSSPFRLGSA